MKLYAICVREIGRRKKEEGRNDFNKIKNSSEEELKLLIFLPSPFSRLLIPVMLRLEWPVLRNTQVLGLRIRQFFQFNADLA